MLKQVIFIILIISVFSGTVANFYKALETCAGQRNFISECSYDLFENKLSNPECGEDLKRSQICETTFKDCYICQEGEVDCKGLKPDDTYPQICYLCWIKSPAKSAFYTDFQKCIETETKKLSSNHITAFFALIFILIATLI